MFTSVRRYRLTEGSMQELARRVDHGFVEQLRGQPGFVSYEFIDCGRGQVVTVSMFATKEMADLSRELAGQWTETALEDMRFERLGMLDGEVLVSRARPEMLKATHAEVGHVASIRRYVLRRGSVGELMHIVDEVFTAQLEGVEGFEAYHAIDCGDDGLLSVTLCSDTAAAERSDGLARKFVAEHLGGFDLERTETMAGEVLVSRAFDRLLEPAHA